MPAPQTASEAVLQAARDVTKVDTALHGELLGTALLGSVYAVAEGDRAATVRAFVSGFLIDTQRRRSAAATTIRAVFAALVPDATGAAEVTPGPSAPPWVAHLGQARPTGTYSYGDVYGDQTSYVATFAYPDTEAGGPEHAVVALVDHNIGAVKDVFVGAPASRLLDEIRTLCAADDLTWFDEKTDPARVRGEVSRHLEITDSMTGLPGEGSLATDRALAWARLALLPPGEAPQLQALDGAERAALVADFLAGPEAAAAGLADPVEPERRSLLMSLSLAMDHAETFPDADPLRWSPVMVQLFLLDWVPRRAVLSDAEAELLPRALRAWAAYAGRRRGLPEEAVARTVAAIDDLIPVFAKQRAERER